MVPASTGPPLEIDTGPPPVDANPVAPVAPRASM